MSNTKKLTLCALLVALGTTLMIVGATVDVLDLSVCAIASLIVVFVYLEIGSYYPWLVWICTTLATALLYSHSIVWAEYFLVFGIYPLIKAYIERLPKWSWLLVKLAYINATVWIAIAVFEFIIKQSFFGEETLIMEIITYLLINVAFIAYDYFIMVMARFYAIKIRPRIKKLLK